MPERDPDERIPQVELANLDSDPDYIPGDNASTPGEYYYIRRTILHIVVGLAWLAALLALGAFLLRFVDPSASIGCGV